MENLFEKNNWIAPLLAALGAAVGILSGAAVSVAGMIGLATLGGTAGIIGGKVLQDFLTPKAPSTEDLKKDIEKKGKHPHQRFFVEDGADYKQQIDKLHTDSMAAIGTADDKTHDTKRQMLLKQIQAHDTSGARYNTSANRFDVNIGEKLSEVKEGAPAAFYTQVFSVIRPRIESLSTELAQTSDPLAINFSSNAYTRSYIVEGMKKLKQHDYEGAKKELENLKPYLTNSSYTPEQTKAANKYAELIGLLNVYDVAVDARDTCALACTKTNDEKRAQEKAAEASETKETSAPALETVSSISNNPFPAGVPNKPALDVGIGQPKFA